MAGFGPTSPKPGQTALQEAVHGGEGAGGAGASPLRNAVCGEGGDGTGSPLKHAVSHAVCGGGEGGETMGSPLRRAVHADHAPPRGRTPSGRPMQHGMPGGEGSLRSAVIEGGAGAGSPQQAGFGRPLPPLPSALPSPLYLPSISPPSPQASFGSPLQHAGHSEHGPRGRTPRSRLALYLGEVDLPWRALSS